MFKSKSACVGALLAASALAQPQVAFAKTHATTHERALEVIRLKQEADAARLITDFPQALSYYALKEFTYNGVRQPNRNLLLFRDPTVDGLKTGYTDAAGYCLIATSHRPSAGGERRLLSVVLGAVSPESRANESQKLLNWGFQNFDTGKLYSKGQAVETPDVWKGSNGKIKIGFTHDLYVTVPKGSADKIKPRVERNDPLIAPIAENTKVGTLKIMIDDKVFTELPLVALESVGPASFIGRAFDSLRLLFK